MVLTVEFELFATVLKKPFRRLCLIIFVLSPWFPRHSFRRFRFFRHYRQIII